MSTFDTIVDGINAGESRLHTLPEELILDDAGVRITAIVRTDTSRFEPRITVGNRTKDSDALLSSWVQDDWSGGGLTLKHNEGATDSRFRWSTCWTLNRTQLALPPKRNSYTLSDTGAGAGNPVTVPLLEMLDSAGDNRVWASSGKRVHALYYASGTFASAGHADLSHLPANHAAMWNDKLWIPCTTAVVDVSRTGTIGTQDTAVKAVAVQTWDKRLFALTSDGYLRYRTLAGSGWETASADLKLPEDQTPIDLCEWYDRQGNLTVFILTDQQLWGYDPESDTIIPTDVQWPPNLSACFVPWRSESLYVATGLGIERITRDGVRTPMGLDRDYGLPPSLLSLKGLAIRALCPTYNLLLALVCNTSLDEDDAFLMAWNESGWHCLGTVPGNKGGSWSPKMLTTATVGPDGRTYRVWVGGERNQIGIGMGGDCEIQTWALSPNRHGPLQNIYRTVGEFELSAIHYTGWFDAGMEGFDKLLSHFDIEQTQPEGVAWSSSVNVTVAFRTEADPYTWITLGSTSAYGINRFRFGVDADNFSRGVGCNRVEFRYMLASNSNTRTPVIDHTNLKFITLSQPGASWTVDIPLDQENVNGLGPREISDWLAQATYSQSFMKMIHGGKTYRVRIAQHASNEGLADNPFRRDSAVIVECPDGVT